MPIRDPVVLTYQVVTRNNVAYPYNADVYFPESKSHQACPVLVYFHSGGLTAGSRKRNSWFPHWLLRECLQAGFAFVAADYTLLVPGTAHDMVRDVKRLFWWIQHELDLELGKHGGPKVSPERVVVAGESAGGYLAYLSGVHAQPKPRAIASLYGMGGDFLSDHYVTRKTTRFSHWIPYLKDPAAFINLDKCADDSPLILETPTDDDEPRVTYFTWLVQEATFLSVLGGDPTLGRALNALPSAQRDTAIGSAERSIFPQLGISQDFPPTFLVHGTADTAVLVEESDLMSQQLGACGVQHRYVRLHGVEHGFDWGTDKCPAELVDLVPFLQTFVGMDRGGSAS